MKLTELLHIFQQEGKELDEASLSNIQTDLEKYQSENTATSIKILSTIGAWIAALSFLAFIGLLDLFQSQEGMIGLGIILIAVSLVSSKESAKKPSLEPFTVVFNIVGQIVLGVGVFFLDYELLMLCIVGLFVEAVILVLTRSAILKFGAIIIFHLCILGILWEFGALEGMQLLIGISAWFFMWIQLYEAKLISEQPKWVEYYNPISIGLASSFLFILTITINKDIYKGEIHYWWISSIFLLGAIIYFCHISWKVYELGNLQFLALLSISIILAPTIFSPGIAASLLVLIVGFQRGQKIILGMGIAFLTVFISSFYYNLQLSLLIKSVILLLTGAFFLSAYFALKAIKHIQTNREAA